MRTRKGIPVKADLLALIQEHGLVVYAMDSYTQSRSIVYGSRADADAKAVKVADSLRAAGFTVTHRLTDAARGLTGQIKIEVN